MSFTAATRRSLTSPDQITSSPLLPLQPRRLALLQLNAAASQPEARVRKREKEPKENRAGTTPPTRAWS
jgi:hypothetical protein